MQGFGTLMQEIRADDFRGRRVRLTASIEAIDVHDRAGLWMRVDDATRRDISFDNMSDRPIHGTTPWLPYELVLVMPEDSVAIAFGVLLSETGEVLVDGMELVVAAERQLTRPPFPAVPVNLDFEE